MTEIDIKVCRFMRNHHAIPSEFVDQEVLEHFGGSTLAQMVRVSLELQELNKRFIDLLLEGQG